MDKLVARAEGRPVAHVGDGLPGALRLQVARARHIHAARGNHLALRRQVQGRHGLFRSHAASAHHRALPARRRVAGSAPPAPPAPPGSARESRCCSPSGRANRPAAQSSVSNPSRRPSSSSTRMLPLWLVPETEIRAHQDGPRAQPLHQQLAHELLRRKARHVRGERQDQHLLDAFFGHQLRRAARARSSAAASAPAPPRGWDADRRSAPKASIRARPPVPSRAAESADGRCARHRNCRWSGRWGRNPAASPPGCDKSAWNGYACPPR